MSQSALTLLLTGLSALGFALAIAAGVLLIQVNGGQGYDAYAYWLAGQNVLEGQPLYWQHVEGALGAYRYPPIFAQLWAPLTLMPALAFSWFWRGICVLSLRYLAGSWRNVGLWCLLPLTLTELSIANVTFPVAALTLAALGRQSWAAAWAGALKLGGLLILPYLWIAKPGSRKPVIVGLVSLGAVCLRSYAIAPASWALYVESLTWLSVLEPDSRGVIKLVNSGLVDLAIRVGFALILVLLAIHRGSDRLAFTATVITAPVLALSRLAPLLALPRLGSRR